MTFKLDEKLASSTIEIADWPLCKVLFKNEKEFPWFLLVPQRADITEIYQLNEEDQQQLTKETSQLSNTINDHFKPDKINVAAIGNQVPQLHVHVVGRFKTDPLWPESIWQTKYENKPYDDSNLKTILKDLKSVI